MASSRTVPKAVLRWIRAKTNDTAGGKGHLTKKAFEWLLTKDWY